MKRLLALAGLVGALALAGSAFAGSAGATVHPGHHLWFWPAATGYHWQFV